MKKIKQVWVPLREEQEARQLLKRYLDERGWKYDWGTYINGKKLDAVLLNDEGQPVAGIGAINLVGVSASLLGEVGRTRQMMSLGECIPLLLAVYSADPGNIEKQIYNLSLRAIVDDLLPHPTLSAIGILHTVRVDKLVEDLTQDGLPPQNHEKDASRDKDRAKLLEVVGALLGKHAEKPRFEAVCMKILLNPYAKLPWSEEWWGIYDEVWRWDDQQRTYERVYDGRWELLRTYHLVLAAGMFRVEWKQPINDSRSENFYEERE
jgi:hypothetical protein